MRVNPWPRVLHFVCAQLSPRSVLAETWWVAVTLQDSLRDRVEVCATEALSTRALLYHTGN